MDDRRTEDFVNWADLHLAAEPFESCLCSCHGKRMCNSVSRRGLGCRLLHGHAGDHVATSADCRFHSWPRPKSGEWE